jgi:hypothetical protein
LYILAEQRGCHFLTAKGRSVSCPLTVESTHPSSPFSCAPPPLVGICAELVSQPCFEEVGNEVNVDRMLVVRCISTVSNSNQRKCWVVCRHGLPSIGSHKPRRRSADSTILSTAMKALLDNQRVELAPALKSNSGWISHCAGLRMSISWLI